MNKEEMNKLCRKFVDRQAGFWFSCDNLQSIQNIQNIQKK
jgi:hypothetical protein